MGPKGRRRLLKRFSSKATISSRRATLRWATQRRSGPLLHFPDINPVLFQFGPFHTPWFDLGPFAIRWYALAYVATHILRWAGRRHVVGMIRNPSYQTHSAANRYDFDQIDDLITCWPTFGVYRRRTGWATPCSTGLATLIWTDPVEIHEKTWRPGGMSFSTAGPIGVFVAYLGLRARFKKIDALRLGDLIVVSRADRRLPGAHRQLHQRHELWGCPTTLLTGHGLPRRRTPAAPPEPAL